MSYEINKIMNNVFFVLFCFEDSQSLTRYLKFQIHAANRDKFVYIQPIIYISCFICLVYNNFNNYGHIVMMRTQELHVPTTISKR